MDFSNLYSETGSIILDAAVLLVLVLITVLCGKKGFFKSLMVLAALAVAVFAAIMAARYLTDPITEKLLPKAEAKVEKALENTELDLSNVDLAAMGFNEDHPDTLTDEELEQLRKNEGIDKVYNGLSKLKMSDARIRKILASSLKKAGGAAEDYEDYLTTAAKNLSYSSLHTTVKISLLLVTFLLVAVILLLVVNGMRELMHKVTLVGATDTVLGVLLGLAIALLLIFIAFYAFESMEWESYLSARDHTLLAKLADRYNVIKMFFD